MGKGKFEMTLIELVNAMPEREKSSLFSFLKECEETKRIGSDVDCGPAVLKAFRAGWIFIAIASGYEPKVLI